MVPQCPSLPFLGWSGSTKIDYRNKGTLILTSLLQVPGAAKRNLSIVKTTQKQQSRSGEADQRWSEGTNRFLGRACVALSPMPGFVCAKWPHRGSLQEIVCKATASGSKNPKHLKRDSSDSEVL